MRQFGVKRVWWSIFRTQLPVELKDAHEASLCALPELAWWIDHFDWIDLSEPIDPTHLLREECLSMEWDDNPLSSSGHGLNEREELETALLGTFEVEPEALLKAADVLLSA